MGFRAVLPRQGWRNVWPFREVPSKGRSIGDRENGGIGWVSYAKGRTVLRIFSMRFSAFAIRFRL
jgi:hypothetical protein